MHSLVPRDTVNQNVSSDKWQPQIKRLMMRIKVDKIWTDYQSKILHTFRGTPTSTNRWRRKLPNVKSIDPTCERKKIRASNLEHIGKMWRGQILRLLFVRCRPVFNAPLTYGHKMVHLLINGPSNADIAD